MRIETLYFGDLRNITGRARQDITLGDGARLRDLLEDLFLAHGEAFRKTLDLGNSHVILVNGQHHGILQGMETPLKDGDRVVFLPVTMGG
ncbi:MAG: MoaD/ThiS family protein [Deltaproteobacteria bacterium]|nr:MoaD/ThiS family protein [Deltaproteobacteria bacterium]MBW2139257.1 MoaD/ThiS family protein [Deltaproteobacteria bacterium]